MFSSIIFGECICLLFSLGSYQAQDLAKWSNEFCIKNYFLKNSVYLVFIKAICLAKQVSQLFLLFRFSCNDLPFHGMNASEWLVRPRIGSADCLRGTMLMTHCWVMKEELRTTWLQWLSSSTSAMYKKVELSHILLHQAALVDGFSTVYFLLPQQYWLFHSLLVGLWANK